MQKVNWPAYLNRLSVELNKFDYSLSMLLFTYSPRGAWERDIPPEVLANVIRGIGSMDVSPEKRVEAINEYVARYGMAELQEEAEASG